MPLEHRSEPNPPLLDLAEHRDGRLLTAQEVAARLRVPTSWVRAETRAERIPYVPIGSRYKRYDADAIDAWWQRRARGPWRRNQ